MQADSELVGVLRKQHPGSARFGVDLKTISRWGIGGPAIAVVEPRSVSELSDFVGLMTTRPEAVFVAGDMSNVLFDSRGLDGVVLRVSQALSALTSDGPRITAQAGIAVPRLARITADLGLAGLEHTVGIPGTLGGLVTMNGGSQRKGVGQVVARVTGVDRDGGLVTLSHEECAFSYRQSALQNLPLVVVEVDLELGAAPSEQVHSDMDAVIASRRSRFPEDLPNCGSTFLSDPAMYDVIGAPGRAIEAAGLKGYQVGGAQISPQHANFVVNRGNATSDDVLDVIAHVRRTVRERTGFSMDCEVRFVSRDGRVVPAHEAAEARHLFDA